MSRNRQIAIGLLVVTLISFLVFITSVDLDLAAGNQKALLAVAIGGTSTTIAAWLWRS